VLGVAEGRWLGDPAGKTNHIPQNVSKCITILVKYQFIQIVQ